MKHLTIYLWIIKPSNGYYWYYWYYWVEMLSKDSQCNRSLENIPLGHCIAIWSLPAFTRSPGTQSMPDSNFTDMASDLLQNLKSHRKDCGQFIDLLWSLFSQRHCERSWIIRNNSFNCYIFFITLLNLGRVDAWIDYEENEVAFSGWRKAQLNEQNIIFYMCCIVRWLGKDM
jgi:hypothetical protein